MYNPRKIWLLYAKRLYDLLLKNADEISVRLRENLEATVAELKLDLDEEQNQHLFDIALALFHDEYLEAYHLSSIGQEPETELTAAQSCVIVEETTGYPVTDLFKAMVQEIMSDEDKPEEEVADTLILKFGAYPAQAILRINIADTSLPQNHVPDYCLAQSIQAVVARMTQRTRKSEN
jgi:hypothetical protein